jgi:streptogramin lyase
VEHNSLGAIVAGPDGNVWFAYNYNFSHPTLEGGTAVEDHSGIVKMTPAGSMTEYGAEGEDYAARSMITGPDGNIWFTTESLNKITTSGEHTGYAVGARGQIAVGSEGDLWFLHNWQTVYCSKVGCGPISHYRLGRSTTSGQGAEYTLPGEPETSGIATGPDGRLWITEPGAGKIAKVSPYLYTGPSPTPAPEHTPQPGSAVDYGVSVSDSEATASYESVTPFYVPGYTDLLGGDAVASNGDIWVADTGKSRVYELSPKGEELGYVGSAESSFTNAGCSSEMCLPMGVALNSSGDLWVIDANGYLQEYSEGKRLQDFNVAQPSFLFISLSLPWGVAVEGGHVFVSFEAEGIVKEYTESGEYVKTIGQRGSGEGQLGAPRGLIAQGGNLWVADSGNDRVEECQIESGACHTALGQSSFGDGRVLSPSALALEADGDIWVADEKGARAVKFSPEGHYLEQYGPGAPADKRLAGPRGIALDPEGGLVLASFDNPVLHVPHQALEALRSNDGLQPMDENAVLAWGQHDTPVEGTAVLPPSEAQSWPATSYRRATVYYLDDPGRLVNVASPSNSPYGAVSTTEYGPYHNVIRTLTPENRIRALEAGRERSAETAKLLSTESLYDGEGGEAEARENPTAATEPGTELVEERGPQHMVRLQHPEGALKSEVLARERTVYYYDKEEIHNNETGKEEVKEPPSEGETYHLVTATQTFADLEGIVLKNPQVEVRTTKTSYSGQGNLG